MSDSIPTPAERPADFHLMLTATSTAQANGVDTNNATARLSRHGQASGGQLLVFTLSGNAVFTGGDQHIAVTTNSQGEATVYFTDTRQETVLVTCHYYQTQARENSRFVASPRADTDISAQVLANGSPANGSDINAVYYTVYDASNNPIPGVQLRITTTGSARLVSSTRTTDINGHVLAGMTNTVPEQVLLTAEVVNAPQVVNHIYLRFSEFVSARMIIATVIRDRQPANSLTPNQVVFTVFSLIDGTPQPGLILDFSVTGSARLAIRNGITGPDGSFTVGLTNPVAESVRLTADLRSERVTLSHIDVSWI